MEYSRHISIFDEFVFYQHVILRPKGQLNRPGHPHISGSFRLLIARLPRLREVQGQAEPGGRGKVQAGRQDFAEIGLRD